MTDTSHVYCLNNQYYGALTICQSWAEHVKWYSVFLTAFYNVTVTTHSLQMKQRRPRVGPRLPWWLNGRGGIKWPWGFDFISTATPNCFLKYKMLLFLCGRRWAAFSKPVFPCAGKRFPFFLKVTEQPAEATIVGGGHSGFCSSKLGTLLASMSNLLHFLICFSKNLVWKHWVYRTSW